MVQVYENLLAVLAVGIFFTRLPGYIFERHWSWLTPKLWILGFAFVAAPVITQRLLRSNLRSSPIVIWCLAFVWVSLAWYFLSTQSENAWQGLRYRFLTVFSLFAFTAVVWNGETVAWAQRTMVVATIVAVILNVYDILIPFQFSQTLGRGAGLYVNPNGAGEALVLGMILGIGVIPTSCRVLYILVIGLGVLATVSRSSMLAWLISVVALVHALKLSLKEILKFVAIAAALLIAITLGQLFRTGDDWASSLSLYTSLAQRIEWFSDPLVTDEAIGERLHGARVAWRLIEQRILLGHGTGTTMDIWGTYDGGFGPHNIYLWFLVDHGLVGLTILPLLVVAAVGGSSGQSKSTLMIASIALLVLGMASHNLLENSHILVVVAVMSGLNEASRQSAQ